MHKKLSTRLFKQNTKKIFTSNINSINIKGANFNSILLFFCIWGKEYIDDFSNNCLQYLLNSNFIKSKYVKKCKLIIWTSNKDKIYFESKIKFLKLENKINLEIVEIDFLLKNKLKFKHKYEFLLFLQKVFISSRSVNDIIFLLYPDFVFSEDSIYNAIQKLENENIDAVLAPVPQIEKEKYYEYVEKNKGFIKEKNKLLFFAKDNIHPIVRRSICNIGEIKDNTLSILSYLEKDKYMLIKSFHIHPVAIRVKYDLDILFTNGDSLDEQFINFYVDKFYIPETSNEMVFFSLFEKDGYKNPYPAKYDSDIHTFWLLQHTGYTHVNIFFKNYFLIFNDVIDKDEKNKSIHFISKYIDKTLSNLELHIAELKMFPQFLKLRQDYHKTAFKKDFRYSFQKNIFNYMGDLRRGKKNINLSDYNISNNEEIEFITKIIN